MRRVRVNYPKRKSRIRLEDLGDIKEPDRHSMYQVLLDNLKIAKRATYLHRIIYIGEHTFLCCEDGRDCFDAIIRKSNETYCIEKLSGFFLYYTNYLVHMVEGDEDNLNKHIGMLLDKRAKHAVFLGNVKLLIHVSHINQRFFEDWVYFTGVPPKLLEKLDINADLQQSGRHIYNCIKKVYGLIGNYAEDLSKNISLMEEAKVYKSLDIETISSIESTPLIGSRLYSSSSYMSTSLEGTTAKEYKMFLPEYELLDFALKTSFTMKLQDYYNLYGVVPMRDIYKDRVWPVPHDFIPYDVFEKPYDCITELPKERDPLLTSFGASSFVSASTVGATSFIIKKESVAERKSNADKNFNKTKSQS